MCLLFFLWDWGSFIPLIESRQPEDLHILCAPAKGGTQAQVMKPDSSNPRTLNKPVGPGSGSSGEPAWAERMTQPTSRSGKYLGYLAHAVHSLVFRMETQWAGVSHTGFQDVFHSIHGMVNLARKVSGLSFKALTHLNSLEQKKRAKVKTPGTMSSPGLF